MAPGPESGYFQSYEREPFFYPESISDPQKPSKKPRGWAAGPDCLLSWFIAVANFLINFIVVGLGRMSGILYVVFMHKFDVDRQTSSVPFIVQQAARNLFGPVAGILGQKYGVLSVTAVGGLLGAVSTSGCFFAKDINTITVLWGLGFGICTAFTTSLNQIPIDEYFEKYRTSAGGLAFSGGSVGAFLFPVLLELLLHHYGVKGTFMAMGLIILIVVPISFTMRRPPWRRKSKIAAKEELNNYKTFESRRQAEMIKNLIDRDSKNIKLSKSISNEDNLNNLNTPNPKVIQGSKGSLNLPHGTSKILNFSASNATPKSVNFALIRQNSEIVYQLFSLTMSPEALVQYSILDTSPIVKELEDLYNFLRQPKKVVKPSAPLGFVMDELTRSVHLVEVRNEVTSDLNSGNEKSEAPNYECFEDNPRWVFMSIKLRELCDFYPIEEVIHYFPVHMHSSVVKMMVSLKDLNEIVVKSSVPSAIASTDKLPDWKDDVTNREEERRKRRESKPSNSFCQHIKTAIRLHKNPMFILISLCRGVFMLTFIPMVTIIVDFAMDKGLPRDTAKYVIAALSLGDLVGRLCLGWITDSGILSMPAYMVVAMLILAVSTGTMPFMQSELSLFPAIMVFGMLQGSLYIRHQVLVSTYMDTHEQTIGMGLINFLSGILGFFIPYYLGYFRDTLGAYDKMFYVNGGVCAVVGLMWLLEPCLKKYTPAYLYEKLQNI